MPRANPYLTEHLRARLAALSRTGLGGTEENEPDPDATDPGEVATVLRRPPADAHADPSTDSPTDSSAGSPEGESSGFRRWTAGRHFTRTHAVVVAIVLTLAVGFTGWSMLRARDHAVGTDVPITMDPASTDAPESSEPPVEEPSEAAPAMIAIHVVGEVAEPGVVELPEGARVGEAVEAAGGLTSEAVPGRLNLAQRLNDGEQVFVSASVDPPSEVVPAGGASGGGSRSAPDEQTGGQVNLNTATAEQLETLPGVGPATAEAILAWRQANGRFTRIEELQEVDGIGPKTFARLKSLVTV